MLEERFPDDLQWEALVDVLRGKVKVNTHCYEVSPAKPLLHLSAPIERTFTCSSSFSSLHYNALQATDLASFVRYTNEFKFPIAAFHHAHEAYLVPDLLKQAWNSTPAVALFATQYAASSFPVYPFTDPRLPVQGPLQARILAWVRLCSPKAFRAKHHRHHEVRSPGPGLSFPPL